MVGWLTDWMTGCMINDFNVKRKLDHEILLTTNSLTLTLRSPPPPEKVGIPPKRSYSIASDYTRSGYSAF